jgi:hypothetical protein
MIGVPAATTAEELDAGGEELPAAARLVEKAVGAIHLKPQESPLLGVVRGVVGQLDELNERIKFVADDVVIRIPIDVLPDVALELNDELLDALAMHRTGKLLEHEQVTVRLLEAVVIVNIAGH